MKKDVIGNLKKSWTKLNKYFRYKKRITYKTTDNLFNFDLTVVKSSNKKTLRGENKIYKKKDVKDYMKKYIVVPPYVVNIDEWFNKLKDSDDVELIGKKYERAFLQNLFKNLMYLIMRNLLKLNWNILETKLSTSSIIIRYYLKCFKIQ